MKEVFVVVIVHPLLRAMVAKCYVYLRVRPRKKSALNLVSPSVYKSCLCANTMTTHLSSDVYSLVVKEFLVLYL